MYIYFLALEVIIIIYDAYFQSSREDMAVEVTVLSVKSMDVTYKTHPG